MGLATRLAGRSLKVRPGRTFLSILGIALGIAIAIGVLVLDYNTVEGMRRRKTNDSMPDLMLRAPSGGASIEQLRQTDGVSLAIEGFQESAECGAGAAREQVPGRGIRLLAFEAKHFDDFGLAPLESGRPLTKVAGYEALIGGQLAETLGVGLGDSIWLARPARLGQKVCEDGKLVAAGEPVLDQPTRENFTVVGILARTGIGRTALGQVAVVDLAAGRSLFAGQTVRSTYWAKRDPSADNEALDASLSKVFALEVNRGALVGQAADERAFRTGVRVAGLFALVLGLFVIFHTLSMSLTERVTEVGTLHALGSTRVQIARVFFAEAWVQALVGGLLGMALGLLMAKGLLLAGMTTLGAGKHITLFLVPWGTVVGLAGAGVGMALCGSVYPLLLMGGADPGAALRGDQEISANRRQRGFALFYGALIALALPAIYFVLVPAVGGNSDRMVKILLGAVGGLLGLVALALVAPRVIATWAAWMVKPWVRWAPFAARMARSGMLRSPGRIGASASAIALVAAGFVGLRGLTDSLRGEIDTWAESALQGKVWVKGLPPTKFEELSKHLRSDEAVLGVEMGQAAIHVPFLVLGLDIESVSGYGPLGSDPSLREWMTNQHGIVLSRRLAQEGPYHVGDSIYLEKSNHEIQPFRVVAIDDAYGHWSSPDERMYGIVDRRYLEQYFCVDAQIVDRVGVKLKGGEDSERVLALLRDFYASQSGEEPGPWSIETGQQIHAFHRYDLERDFLLFDVLVVLSAGLAALGVLNGQLLAMLERTRELGITRALGASRSQIALMVWIEALALSAVGGLFGVSVGAAIVPPVVGSVESLSGLDLPPVLEISVLLQGLLGAVLVGSLAAIYPVLRLGRLDTQRAVRTG